MHESFLEPSFHLANAIDPHKTASNPRVGCIVVRQGKVVATGVHKQKGGDHAEVDALKKLEGQDVSDCTVYITLEPCDCFSGKQTPSCTQLLINKKVKKVVIGSLDVRFSGKNVQKLKDAGILVETCYSASHYEAHGASHSARNDHTILNPFYDHFFYTKRPYICLKMAQSIDGKVRRCQRGDEDKKIPSLSTQYPAPISNASSRKIVHQMRAHYQALLTTTKTIREDNARLDVRLDPIDLSWKPSNPIVLVLGKESDIPAGHEFWKRKDREVHFFDTRNIESVIDQAAKMGIISLMTELGPTVATQLMKENLVDEIQLFMAPSLFGQGKSWAQAIDLNSFYLQKVENIFGDIRLCYKKKTS